MIVLLSVCLTILLSGLHVKFLDVITEQHFLQIKTVDSLVDFLILENTRNQLNTAGNFLTIFSICSISLLTISF